MANYLITHYKGKYRILCDVCKDTNDFPRKLDGTYEDIDCYISCDKDIKIFSYGHGVLDVYIPSIRTGRNILKQFYREQINKSNTSLSISERTVTIKGQERTITTENISIIDEDLYQSEIKNNTTIFNLYETDGEVLFKFKAKDMDKLEKYLKPKTSGANISPFSVKNRPKTNYSIPTEELEAYKKITSNLPFEQVILIGTYTKDFIKSLATKKNTYEDIKADMIFKGLKSKEYIHSIGKFGEYIKYLEKELCQS